MTNLKLLFDRYNRCSYLYNDPLTDEEYLQLRTGLQNVFDACEPFGDWMIMVRSFVRQHLLEIESTLRHRGMDL